jgi:hypothetical protein
VLEKVSEQAEQLLKAIDEAVGPKIEVIDIAREEKEELEKIKKMLQDKAEALDIKVADLQAQYDKIGEALEASESFLTSIEEVLSAIEDIESVDGLPG